LSMDRHLEARLRDAHPERKAPASMEVSLDGPDSEAAILKPLVDAEAPRNEPGSRGEAAETRGIQRDWSKALWDIYTPDRQDYVRGNQPKVERFLKWLLSKRRSGISGG
jgi:hypothetical protein